MISVFFSIFFNQVHGSAKQMRESELRDTATEHITIVRCAVSVVQQLVPEERVAKLLAEIQKSLLQIQVRRAIPAMRDTSRIAREQDKLMAAQLESLAGTEAWARAMLVPIDEQQIEAYKATLIGAQQTHHLFPNAEELCRAARCGNLVFRNMLADIIQHLALPDAIDWLREADGWQKMPFTVYVGDQAARNNNLVVFNPQYKIIIVACEGTVGWDGWLTNLNTDRHPAREGFSGSLSTSGEMSEFFDVGADLHRGFHKAALSAQESLLGIIDSFLANEDPKNIKYILTGHSFGGALATIFSASLYQRYLVRNGIDNSKNNLSVITFGGPRVCHEEVSQRNFNTKLNGHRNVVRVVTTDGNGNGSDFLTQLPADGPYKHLDTRKLCLKREGSHDLVKYLQWFRENDPAREEFRP